MIIHLLKKDSDLELAAVLEAESHPCVGKTTAEAIGVKGGGVKIESDLEKVIDNGDVIIEFDGRKVKDVRHLQDIVSGSKPGKKVEATVIRDGKEKRLKIELGEMPESVDVGAGVYMATKEEYETLSSSVKDHMTVDIVSKKIINPAFDEDQLAWMKRVLTQANMVTDKETSEELILKETSKLRTTVSLLRHLASRRGAGMEGKKLRKSE